MCIIAYKTTEYNDWWKSAIDTMEENNRHGNGITVIDDKSVWWKKGISLAEVHEIAKKYKRCILHFRIASKGKISSEMCHPFLISSTRGGINTPLEGHLRRGELLLHHNGTIQGLGDVKTSDTCEAAREISPMSKEVANMPQHVIEALRSLDNISRLIVVGKTKREVEIALSKNWITEPTTGDSFSNMSFNPL